MTNMHKSYKKELGIYPGGMEHKTPVLGMMQREGKVKVMGLDKADSKTIRPLLNQHIDATSEVVTDGFAAYGMLPQDSCKTYYIESLKKHNDNR